MVSDPGTSLADTDDDVRAAAAGALAHTEEALVRDLPNEVQHVLKALTAALAVLDDLTSSTAAVLDLLGSCCARRAPTRRRKKKRGQSFS